MQFLRENKKLFYIAVILPIFFFYLDRIVILRMRDFHKINPTITLINQIIDPLINFVAHGSTLIGIALLVYLFGSYLNQKLSKAGRSLFVSLISAGIVVQILKHLIGRARPRVTDNLMFIGPSLRSGFDSFPSGHTTSAFCLAYILSQHYQNYKYLFYIFAFIVGIERVEDTAHFPSDVLAGAFLGLIVGKISTTRILPSELCLRSQKTKTL